VHQIPRLMRWEFRIPTSELGAYSPDVDTLTTSFYSYAYCSTVATYHTTVEIHDSFVESNIENDSTVKQTILDAWKHQTRKQY
jgi:hypothetical protein